MPMPQTPLTPKRIQQIGTFAYTDALTRYPTLVSELDQAMGMSGAAKAFTPTWSGWHSGGGCMSLSAALPGSVTLLLTDLDGCAIPEQPETQGYSLGLYDEELEPLGELDYGNCVYTTSGVMLGQPI